MTASPPRPTARLNAAAADTAHMFNWIIRYLVLNVKYIVDIFLNKICPRTIIFTDFKPIFSISPEEIGSVRMRFSDYTGQTAPVRSGNGI
jgi:hypothetical protein